MPKMSRDRYIATWLRMLSLKETRFKRDLKKFFKNQAREIAAAFKKSDHSGAERAIDNTDHLLATILQANYIVTIEDFRDFAYTMLNENLKKADNKFSNLTDAFIKRQAVQKAKGINTTTKNMVARVIQNGQKNGLSINEIATNIENRGLVDVARAATIARTETHMAAGYAMHSIAAEVGFALNKTWVAVEDDRTRNTHIEADGQTVGQDEYFEVGDDSLLYPGDPDGSPEEIINCRCSAIYEPVNKLGTFYE